MVQIPVYAFTGFLDSGKTKFIQETLEDERFNAGERTLLLVFEEGEEEYDFSTYPHKNVYLETLVSAARLVLGFDGEHRQLPDFHLRGRRLAVHLGLSASGDGVYLHPAGGAAEKIAV